LQREEERPKEKEKGKTRNIDHFMEELKHEHEMRERRNQEREHWREGRHTESSAVSPKFECVHTISLLHLSSLLNIIESFATVTVFPLQPSSRFDELPDDFDPSGKLPGSFDDGDPQTTNLYVGNLSPQVRLLLRIFLSPLPC
jgi:U2-associated protein SR140